MLRYEGPGCYRFLNTEEKVIYIGSSKNIQKRLNSHFGGKKGHLGKDVYNQVARVEIIPLESYGDALAAEQWSINHYKPRYNKRDKIKNIDIKIDPKYDYLDSKWKVYWRLQPLDRDRIEQSNKEDMKAIAIATVMFILVIGMFIF